MKIETLNGEIGNWNVITSVELPIYILSFNVPSQRKQWKNHRIAKRFWRVIQYSFWNDSVEIENFPRIFGKNMILKEITLIGKRKIFAREFSSVGIGGVSASLSVILPKLIKFRKVLVLIKVDV